MEEHEPQGVEQGQPWQDEIARLQEQVASLTRVIESLQGRTNGEASSSSRPEASVAASTAGTTVVGMAPRADQQFTFQIPNPSQTQTPLPNPPQTSQTSHEGFQLAFQPPHSSQQELVGQPQIPFYGGVQQQPSYQCPQYQQEQVPLGQGHDPFSFGNLGLNDPIFTFGESRVSTMPNAPPIHPQPMFTASQNIPHDRQESYEANRKEEKEKLTALEERLRAIEGSKALGPLNPEELCLVPGVVVPKKFKVPEFEKYAGATNPKTHLIGYCREMTEVAHDDKLLIHFFHKSLTGAALKWYMQLDRAHVKNWKDLADAFIKQYRYNLDIAPNRTDLQGMEKKTTESFKEYAQRWRELAAQVDPPLADKEMAMTFIDTMKSPYYEYLIGNSSDNFADLVTTGERVEKGLKKGKIVEASTEAATQKKTGTAVAKKKEGEVHQVESGRDRSRGYRGNNPRYNNQNQGGCGYYVQTPQVQQPQPVVANLAMMQPQPQTFLQPQNQPFPQQYQQYQQYPQQYPQMAQFPNPQMTPVFQQPHPHQPRPRGAQSNYARPINEEPLPQLPVPASEIYKQLLAANQIVPIPSNPLTPPFPRWYDENARCAYHSGAVGHSTDNCVALKRKIQHLITHGWIKFGKTEKQPSVNTNPLPTHGVSGSRSVNMIEVESIDERVQMGEAKGKNVYDKEIEGQESTEEVNMVGEERSFTPKPLIIWYEEPAEVSMTMPMFIPKPIIIEPPTAFPYKSNKVVPWNYNAHISVDNASTSPELSQTPQTLQTPNPQMLTPQTQSQLDHQTQSTKDFASAIQGQISYLSPQPLQPAVVSSEPEADSVDATGAAGMTRSGRVYLSEEIERKRKGKGKMQDEEEPITEHAAGATEMKKPVTDEEAAEFLKMVKQSEYCIVDQLKKTPAKISILSLILASEPHRQALQKVLNESYVKPDIGADMFGNLVNQIQATNYITFTDDEVDPAGTGHVKALHISLACKGYSVARVLIDNGSALNVLPLKTLNLLPIDQSLIRPSRMVVKAFDGAKSEVVGDIDLDLKIGPCTFTVTFQIMSITPSYSMLLGRPWIHSAGAIPSSLHQKVKFVVDGKLITISGEESLLVTRGPSVPYIEPSEETIDSSFQVFEIATTTRVPEWSPIPRPTVSKAAVMMAKQMLKDCYVIGKGLGANLQGIKEPLQVVENQGTFGLGYKPSRKDYERVREEKKEKRLARLQNREPNLPKLKIPHIRVTFPRSAHTVGYVGHLIPPVQITPAMIIDLSEFLSDISINLVEGNLRTNSVNLSAVEMIEQVENMENVEVVEAGIDRRVQRVQISAAYSTEESLISQVMKMFAWGLEEEEEEHEETESVAMVQVKEIEAPTTASQPLVYPTPEGVSLTNWTEELLPAVFTNM